MILQIIIGLAAVFGLYWTIREKKTFPAIITLGMIVGIILILLPFPTLQLLGFYFYMGFVALAFIYGLIKKDKTKRERVIISLMAVSIFAYWLWVLNHWHGNAVLLVIPALLAVMAGIFSQTKLKDELGFLTILALDAIAIILENWMKAN